MIDPAGKDADKTYYAVKRNGSNISLHRFLLGAWFSRAWYDLTHRSR